MKKTIAFFITITVLITLAALEIRYLDKVFQGLREEASILYSEVAADPELLNMEQHLDKAKHIQDQWEKARGIMLVVIPHILVDDTTYRIVTLRENLITRDHAMAMVSAAVLEKNFEILLNHTKPYIRSII